MLSALSHFPFTPSHNRVMRPTLIKSERDTGLLGNPCLRSEKDKEKR